MGDLSLFRELFLALSDHLSQTLRASVPFVFQSQEIKPFSEFVHMHSSFSYIGVFSFQQRGVFVLIDPNLIYCFANRMMGGAFVMPKNPEALFTVSEEFMGTELLSFFEQYFQKLHLPISFQRVSHSLNRIYTFLPEESVLELSFLCVYESNLLGSIRLCLPASVLEGGFIS